MFYKDIQRLFYHPKFTASHVPRPGAHVWDEHGSYTAKPNNGIGDLLGLSGAGCEFGACSFQQGQSTDPHAVIITGQVTLGYILNLGIPYTYVPSTGLVCGGLGPTLATPGKFFQGAIGLGETVGGDIEKAAAGNAWSFSVQALPVLVGFNVSAASDKSGVVKSLGILGFPGVSVGWAHSWCTHIKK